MTSSERQLVPLGVLSSVIGSLSLFLSLSNAWKWSVDHIIAMMFFLNETCNSDAAHWVSNRAFSSLEILLQMSIYVMLFCLSQLSSFTKERCWMLQWNFKLILISVLWILWHLYFFIQLNYWDACHLHLSIRTRHHHFLMSRRVLAKTFPFDFASAFWIIVAQECTETLPCWWLM